MPTPTAPLFPISTPWQPWPAWPPPPPTIVVGACVPTGAPVPVVDPTLVFVVAAGLPATVLVGADFSVAGAGAGAGTSAGAAGGGGAVLVQSDPGGRGRCAVGPPPEVATAATTSILPAPPL